MKQKKQILVLIILLFSSILITTISAITYIDECQILDKQDETYILSKDIVQLEENDCIIVEETGITLDCNRKSIISELSYRGILSDKDNTTVKNCKINMGDHIRGIGIDFRDLKDSFILDNELTGMYYGLLLLKTQNVLVENNIADSTRYSGYELTDASNNILKNNIAKNCFTQSSLGNSGCYGLNLYGGSNNIIENMMLTNNVNGIYLSTKTRYNTLNKITIDSSQENGINFNSGGSQAGIDNIIIDSTITNSGKFDVYLNRYAKGNIFTNVVYDKLKEVVISHSSTWYSELIRKWHYRAYVKDNNENPINNAIVKIRDKNNQLIFDLQTNNEGYTNIVDLTEYINEFVSTSLGNQRNYQYPYTITVTYNNQDYQKIHNVFNDNILNDLFILNIAEESNTSACNGADLDNDNKVWLSDWGIFRFNFGKRDCSTQNNFCNKADIDKNGKVWLSDWSIFRFNFGNKNC